MPDNSTLSNFDLMPTRFNKTNTSLLSPCPHSPLYTPEQIKHIEKQWFEAGNQSFALMQQAAWQCASWIHNHLNYSHLTKCCTDDSGYSAMVEVWVGGGNNGGDGWLVAKYLQQFGATVTVINVQSPSTEDSITAKQSALEQGINVVEFDSNKIDNSNPYQSQSKTLRSKQGILKQQTVSIIVDALFGIGLDRAPQSRYKQAIQAINSLAINSKDTTVVAIDVPSGLMAGTGHVFDSCAVQADVTLCLLAQKVGLHIKDGLDYCGRVVELPLIPNVLDSQPMAWLQQSAYPIPARRHNTHKGIFGTVIIVGGYQVAGSQGMGGAVILAASSAFAVGVGKLTVACHNLFHGSVISQVPNAMSIDIEDKKGVGQLISDCDTMAIGMGLGRDAASQDLFLHYLEAGMAAGIDMLIDADGLYHLTNVEASVKEKLVSYTQDHHVWYTPHSGEAARLLDIDVTHVEQDRIQAIKQLVKTFNGSWLLKGAGSLVLEEGRVYVCDAGNAGMATAGMGDVLSGVAVGLMAQQALPKQTRSLTQAVMIHGLAGDALSHQKGEWALQSMDMPIAIGQVMRDLTL